MIVLLLLTTITLCRAQFEFIQLFDAPLTNREGVATVVRNQNDAVAPVFAPVGGSLAISQENGTFLSAVYTISEAALDRANRQSNGWRLSATLTVQHSGASPDDPTAPGDGFSFAFGEIPLASQFFRASTTAPIAAPVLASARALRCVT